MKRVSGLIGALVLASAVSAGVDAPAFSLEGVIVDRALQEPIADATVTLVAAQRTVTTNADGIFSFGAFEVTGTDQLSVSHPGYRTTRIPLGSLPTGAWHIGISLIAEPDVVTERRP